MRTKSANSQRLHLLSYVYIQAYEIVIHAQGTHSTNTNEPLLSYPVINYTLS
jgi:hypothetical protein